MRKLLIFLITFIMPIFANAAAPESFAPLVEKLSPAVVNISTTQKVKSSYGLPEFMFPPGSPFEQFNELFKGPFERRGGGSNSGKPIERETTSLGSGFVISPDGLIVTNNHVVQAAEEITINFQDGSELKAEIVGTDNKVDIAVLRVKSDKKLPFVKFGDSDKMRVGDWIIAIGNPYGLGGSVSAGIISARARDINVGPFDDFLQTDAAINRGNSGGPMFNIKGEVVGINTAIFSPSGGNVGIGFALPAALVKPVIKQIKLYGKAKRAWLGVKIQAVTDEIAESLGMKETLGALVLEVMQDSPAKAAGLLEGDVIIKFDGSEVSQMKKLPRIVAETPIGESVATQIWRNGQVKNLKIKLGEMKDEEVAGKKTQKKIPNGEAKKNSSNILGMALVELTDDIKNKYNIAAESGLVILEVDLASAAHERGIRAGQVIIKANQKRIKTIADIKTVLKQAESDSRSSILLLVASGNEARFIPVPIE